MSSTQEGESVVAIAAQEATTEGGTAAPAQVQAADEVAISSPEEAEANAAAYAALEAAALGEELRAAARYGEIHELNVILRCEKADVALVDGGGNSGLHFAAANGHTSCLTALLEAGAKHVPNASGNTPLHWACLNGHEDTVKELLERVPCKSSATAEALRTRALAARDARRAASASGSSGSTEGSANTTEQQQQAQAGAGQQSELAEEQAITISLGEAAEVLSSSDAAAISEPGIDVLQRNAAGKCAVDVCKTEELTNILLKHESAAALELGLEKTST